MLVEIIWEEKENASDKCRTIMALIIANNGCSSYTSKLENRRGQL